jgi:uncharacterized RDD family membrane protein YckC
MAGIDRPDFNNPSDVGTGIPKPDFGRPGSSRPDLSRPNAPVPERGLRGAGSPYLMSYQGVGIRFVAILIDSIILGIIIGILGFIFGASNNVSGMYPYYGLGWFNILSFIIYIGYYTILEGTSGQTIGKMITRIKVVREDGRPIDIGTALIRNILRVIDGLIFYIIGAILIWTSNKKQRLGDRVAKTVVVKV